MLGWLSSVIVCLVTVMVRV